MIRAAVLININQFSYPINSAIVLFDVSMIDPETSSGWHSAPYLIHHAGVHHAELVSASLLSNNIVKAEQNG